MRETSRWVLAIPVLIGLILLGTGILLLIPPWAVKGTYFRWNVTTREGEVKPSVAYVKSIYENYAEVEFTTRIMSILITGLIVQILGSAQM